MGGYFKTYLTILLISLCSGAWSIESEAVDLIKNRRKKHPVGINVGVLGITGWGNVSADWFITQKLNLEGGFGINQSGLSPVSYFGGIKYHLFGKNTFQFDTLFWRV